MPSIQMALSRYAGAVSALYGCNEETEKDEIIKSDMQRAELPYR